MTTFNGWTNHSTWKANLELIDSDYWAEWVAEEGLDTDALADCMESSIEEMLTIDLDCDSFAYGLTIDFLSEVNWYEIASHITEEA